MPEIAIIATAAPQAPPPSPPANNETQSFSPHLDKAIANRKDQPTDRTTAGKTVEKKESGKTNISNEDISATATKETKQGSSTDNSEKTFEGAEDRNTIQVNNMFLVMAMGQTISEPVANNQSSTPSVPVNSQVLGNNSPLFEFLSRNFANNGDASNQQGTDASNQQVTDASKQQGTTSQKTWPNYPDGGLFNTPLAEAMGISIPATDSLTNAGQSAAVKSENNALLQQLQKIIGTSAEAANLSISVTGNSLKVQAGINNLQSSMATVDAEVEALPPAIAANTIIEFDTDGTIALMPNSTEIPVEKSNQNLTALRHSIQQQYYEGKIAPVTEQENQTASEDNQQGNTFASQTLPSGETPAASAVNADQTNTFAQPLAVLQEGQKLPTADAMRPVTLPSGTVVQQEEVIRQIAERFQISRRDLDTRVNIQLHPAELGELKINLSVKEGTVSAHVIASNQYSQEIIEKNMAKLRAVLENQGFTIDELTVTSKSETAGDFNLFDRQLFSRNDYNPPSAKNSQIPGTFFSLEDAVAEEKTTATGVNVKI